MKKIAIVVPDINFTGGAEIVALNLYELFSPYNEVLIVSLFSSESNLDSNLKIKHLGMNNYKKIPKRLFSFFTNLSLIRNTFLDYDYIIGNNVFRYYLLPILFIKSKLIEIQHLKYEESYNKENHFNLIIRNYIYKCLYKVVVLTERDTNLFNKNGVHNTVTIPNFITNIKPLNKHTSNTILAVGRLTEQKNHKSLLKIWSIFKRNINNQKFKLNIAGDGPLKKELSDYTKELDITDSVVFLGNVKDVDKLYSSSKFMVSTSLYEGFPLTFLEGINNSLPIITYNFNSGANELVNHGFNGYVVEIGDEEKFANLMEKLTFDSAEIEKMTLNTEQIKKSYSPENALKNWMEKVLL